ncbi:MAG: TetR/AcrR family transcriptional regulator [Aeromicrobium sp.]
MPSIRNTGATENVYLDAALDCILDVGVKRTTITDIARRAGVARMTIYRKWPDMLALLGDLMVREWLAEAEEIRPGTTAGAVDAGALAQIVVEVSRSMRQNALFQKIVDVDPEFLIPYIFHRRGRTQDALLDMVRDNLVAGQAAGTVRAGDPAVMARSILLTALGSTVSMRTMTDDVKPGDIDAELLLQLERYLAP